MTKFHGFAEFDRRRLVSSASPLRASELSSRFQLTVLGAELLTLSPLSLSLSPLPLLLCLSLALSQSLCLWITNLPSPPLLDSSSSI